MYISTLYTSLIFVSAISCIRSSPVKAATNANHAGVHSPLGSDCPQCHHGHNVSVAEEELRQIRIEYIKFKLLKMMNLNRAPVISASDRIMNFSNSPFIRQYQEMQRDEQPKEDVTADETVILNGRRERKCPKHVHRKPSVCIYFKVSSLRKVTKYRQLKSVKLAVWRRPDAGDRLNFKQKYVVRLLKSHNHADQRIADEYATSSVSGRPEIMNIELHKSEIEKRIKRGRTKIGLELSCKTCQNAENESPIKTAAEEVNLVLTFGSKRHSRRSRRNSQRYTCESGQTSCCGQELTFSFVDIGWSFIIQPRTFTTKFCKGNCTHAFMPGLDPTYTQPLRELTDRTDLQMSNCCSPTEVAEDVFLYRKEGETTLVERTLRLRVTECGCEY